MTTRIVIDHGEVHTELTSCFDPASTESEQLLARYLSTATADTERGREIRAAAHRLAELERARVALSAEEMSLWDVIYQRATA